MPNIDITEQVKKEFDKIKKMVGAKIYSEVVNILFTFYNVKKKSDSE